MLGRFIPEANFNPVNAIHVRIAGRRAPENLNAGARQEPQMSQIVAHFVWQIDAFHHACTAYLRVAQSCNVHGTAYPTKLVLFTIRHQEDLCRNSEQGSISMGV